MNHNYNRLFTIDPKFVHSFLLYMPNSGETVRRALIRMMLNFLYRRGRLDVALLDSSLGGISFVIHLYKRTQSCEARDNLFMVIFDFVVFTLNAGGARISDEDATLVLEMLRAIEAPQHFPRIFRLLPVHFVKCIIEHVYPKSAYSKPASSVSFMPESDDDSGTEDHAELPILSVPPSVSPSKLHEPMSPRVVLSPGASPPKVLPGSAATALSRLMTNIRPDLVTLVMQGFEALARRLALVRPRPTRNSSDLRSLTNVTVSLVQLTHKHQGALTDMLTAPGDAPIHFETVSTLLRSANVEDRQQGTVRIVLECCHALAPTSAQLTIVCTATMAQIWLFELQKMRLDGTLPQPLITMVDSLYHSLLRDENPVIREVYLDLTEKLALHLKYKGQDDSMAAFLNQALLRIVALDDGNEMILLRMVNCICDLALLCKGTCTTQATLVDNCVCYWH